LAFAPFLKKGAKGQLITALPYRADCFNMLFQPFDDKMSMEYRLEVVFSVKRLKTARPVFSSELCKNDL